MNRFRKYLTVIIIILFIGINILPTINGISRETDISNEFKKLNLENFEQSIERLKPRFKKLFLTDSIPCLKDKTLEISYQEIEIGDRVPHDPIHIKSNSDFAVQAEKEGWSGDGTLDNPYIIEDYDINASKSNGIEVRNTDVYFIIKNCVIHDGINNSGIYFKNVRNSVVNEVVSYNNGVGIDLTDSYNNIISNSSISNNYCGICIYSYGFSHNNTIIGNNIGYNNINGIEVDSSSSIIITKNKIINTIGNGIKISSSSTITITRNNIMDNFRGIDLQESSSITVSENNIENNVDGIDSFSSNIAIFENNIENNVCGIGIFSSNNTLSRNNIDDNIYGVLLFLSADITVSENNMKNNSEGIFILYSLDDTIVDNVFQSNGIMIMGEKIEDWTTHIIENNTANGKPIRYYKNTKDVIVPVNTSQVILANCKHFTIQNLNLSHVEIGIQLGFSSDNTIFGNSIGNTHQGGIYLYSSLNNTITGNKIMDNKRYGIYLDSSHHNSIKKNNFIDNKYHAYFKNSFLNDWINNYWDDWNKILPRPIYGEIEINPDYMAIPWINFDWHPAKEPYEYLELKVYG